MTSQLGGSEQHEQLSALADDELDEREAATAVDWLLQDADAEARWARFHTQRAALHGERTDLLSSGFAERVSAAVANEPPVIAPWRLPRPAPKWRRRAGGGAIAACVALVTAAALFGWEQAERAPGRRSADATQPVATDGVSPVRLTAEAAEISAEGRQRMGQYLARHAEAAGVAAMPGLVQFSRLSGFNASQ